MDKNNRKNITTRTILKSIFSRGNLPRQEDFEKLIDSTFNKADDRMEITDEDGLMLYPNDKEGELISLYKDKDDPTKGKWAIKVSDKKGLTFEESTGRADKRETNDPTLQLSSDGKVGIGVEDPEEALQVKGLINSEGRVGNYLVGKSLADGKWHNIFPVPRKGINGYEIMASAKGKELKGRYALLHAIALSTFGNSRPEINKTVACYGKKWNRLDLRWESRKEFMDDPSKEKRWMRWIPFYKRSTRGLLYNLQIKTRSHFGDDAYIYFRISKLWDERIEPTLTSNTEDQ